MSNLYRGPSIDASYLVLVHLVKQFQRRRFIKIDQPEQELPMTAMFVNGSGRYLSNLYRGPSIDASYKVSVHLADGFQRRRLKCEKLTDDRQQTTDGELKRMLKCEYLHVM